MLYIMPNNSISTGLILLAPTVNGVSVTRNKNNKTCECCYKSLQKITDRLLQQKFFYTPCIQIYVLRIHVFFSFLASNDIDRVYLMPNALTFLEYC